MPTNFQTDNSDLPKVVVTGLNGLVGSTFAQHFDHQYQLIGFDLSDPVRPIDITNADQIRQALDDIRPAQVIHLAAMTDVTRAWEERDDRNGLTYRVNVIGTENLVKACQDLNIPLIHISTAFVFDGQNPDTYLETDSPNPIEWYGQTKAWAEEKVQASHSDWTILRIDFPFRRQSFAKPDVVRKAIMAMEKGYPIFTDHFFGPTYLEDFAKVLDWSLRTHPTGIWHATNNEKWSDWELALALNQQFKLGFEPKPGSLTDYLKTLNRPYQRNTTLNSQKLLANLDFKMSTISSALAQVQL